MEMENIFGQMGISMKVTGLMAKKTEKAVIFGLMETVIQVSG